MSDDTQQAQRTKVRVNVNLDAELIEQAQELARLERRSLSNFLEVLIERAAEQAGKESVS